MTERSLLWTDGTGDGGPYSQDQTRLIFEALANSLNDDYAVLPGRRQELFPYSTGNNNVTVLTGVAVVDGALYENDADKTITITSPAVGTTGKRIVLRKNWSARTVRLVEISSADGTAAIPALTQTDGVTWEESVCSFTITTGGVIASLTDECLFPGGIATRVHPALAAMRGRKAIVNYDAVFFESTDDAYQGGGIKATLGAASSLAVNTTSPQHGKVNLACGTGTAEVALVTGNAGSTTPSLVTGPFDTNLPFWSSYHRVPQGSIGTSKYAVQGMVATLPDGNATMMTGAYFKQEVSGNLFATTRASGAESTTDLGAASSVHTSAAMWEILEIDIGGTLHVFFLKDREVLADHTTNLPGNTDPLGAALAADSNNVGGGTPTWAEIDWIFMETAAIPQA